MAVVIVATGESNSGGYGNNTDATTLELSSRPEVQMWNVLTSQFENLDVGTNNNLDHTGLSSTGHGWELGLANDVASGVWSQNPMYYIQTGQGGSRIAQWDVGGTYWTKWLARIDAAKAYFASESITPEWVVWMSIGINNAIDGTSTATYKTGVIAWINRIKTELPGCKIIMTEVTPTYPTYSTAIREISDSEADVTFVYTQDLALRDINHWSYAGMKQLSTRMTKATQIGLGLLDGTWCTNYSANCYPDGQQFKFSGPSPAVSGAISKTSRLFPDGSFIAWRTDAASVAIVAHLESTKDTTQTFTGPEQFLFGGFRHLGGNLYGGVNYGGLLSRGAAQDEARIYRSGNDGLLQTRLTGGEWQTLYTGTNAFSGVTSVWPKFTNAVTGTTDALTLVFTQSPEIEITAPASSTIALVDVAQSITWTTYDITGTVDVLYSEDGGDNYTVIASGETNDGLYSWTPTADQLSADARIRVRSTSSPSVYGTSGAIKVATTTPGSGGTNTVERQLLREIAQSIYSVIG